MIESFPKVVLHQGLIFQLVSANNPTCMCCAIGYCIEFEVGRRRGTMVRSDIDFLIGTFGNNENMPQILA